jgi:hypothetical protein
VKRNSSLSKETARYEKKQLVMKRSYEKKQLIMKRSYEKK